jgi:hypothetical protein
MAVPSAVGAQILVVANKMQVDAETQATGPVAIQKLSSFNHTSFRGLLYTWNNASYFAAEVPSVLLSE